MCSYLTGIITIDSKCTHFDTRHLGPGVKSSSHLGSLSGHTANDSQGLNLIAAILVHVSGQVAILVRLSGHKTNDSPCLNLIAAILVHVSGQVAILLHFSGHIRPMTAQA
jgi:hypothetical protein